ncbi:MAG: monovalent cation/H(+) antiporter subunit G [Alphaproteobacteria bacterium]|nr:monovalent cation/H(+) antiporter subunit G [Alphaproteobacteria bacterium]
MAFEPIIDLASWVFIVIGGAFLIIGSIGVLRLPDFFTRQHAAGITDTGGAGFMLLGLMLQGAVSLVTVKLILILIFIFFTSPTATHALAQAALSSGVKPLIHDDKEETGSSKT